MQIDILSEADKATICNFAWGYLGFRDEAIAIHRASLRVHGCRSGDPFFDFMSEVDNPCPDLALRAMYRQKLCSIGLMFGAR